MIDPFTGYWTLDLESSRFAVPAPAECTQDIEASADGIRATERIVSAAGAVIEHSVDARFDGAEYAVTGSPFVETMTYTRHGLRRIDGVARKAGVVVFTETVVVSDDGETLAAMIAFRLPDGRTRESVAMFTRSK